MIAKIFFILLAVTGEITAQEPVKCTRDFRKIGCFIRNLKLIPDLLITDLDPTHKNFTTNVDWDDYGGSMHSLACRCREKAAKGQYKYFGIGMYGECSAGKANKALETLFKNPDKSPLSCINGEHENCNVDDVTECAGTVDNDFFYEILQGDCSAKISNGEAVSLFKTQAKIEKSKLITTLPKVGLVYEISIEVYPTSFQAGWASILHMTVGGDHGIYGERIPGIWFWPSSASAKTNRLHICNNINGGTNYCINTKQLPLNKWIKIRVNQAKYSTYVYTIYVNDEKIHEVTNTRPASFDNVNVYTGDPWYAPQAGYVRNLIIAENCYEQPSDTAHVATVSQQKETILKKNNMIATISELCKEYVVSFDVKPTAFAAGWHSVFHLTLGGNYVLYGDRAPGVWFRPSSASAATNSLHICSAVSRNRNYCFNSQQFPKNQWISVKIMQVMVNADVFYLIYLNGKEVHKVKNSQPLDLYDLNAFAADPWYPAQAGSIRNIHIDGECTSRFPIGNMRNLLTNQTIIKKNTLLTTIPKLGKLYEISLEVYPTAFQTGWGSILHMTVSGNSGLYGERVPGIWFAPSSTTAKTNILHICNAVSGNVNYYYNSKPLPLNQWVSIRLSQEYVDKKYIYYTIFINNEKVFKVHNTRPVSFANVNVYVGDPWYAAQPGYIRNLVVSESFFDKPTNGKLSRPAETIIKKGTQLGIISKLCKVYTVTLDVKPTAYAAGWHNVFHVTLGSNGYIYGDRNPGIWFHPSSASAATNALHICAPVNRHRNNCYNSQQLPKNQWISLKISQIKSRDAYYFSIDINGKRVHMIKNTLALDYYDLVAYAGDPWYPAQAGAIRNINIDGGSC